MSSSHDEPFERESSPQQNAADEEYEYEEIEVVEEIEVEEEVEVEEDENDEQKNSEHNNLITPESSVSNVEDKKRNSHLLLLPPHGSEIYLGGIPSEISEDELKSFCESVGEVAEVRIMKGKDSVLNKGFAFVTFRNVELASKAISELHNTVLKGKRIKCSIAEAKNRLFINNVPRHWEEDDLRKIVEEVCPGVTSLQLVKDLQNAGNNRGFAFIDYYNSACAEYARQKMQHPSFKLGPNTPCVSWAEPKNADSSASSSVKAIYVSNLPESVTQEQLKKLFEPHGRIERVIIPTKKNGQENKRIAFVHFHERSCALKALGNTEKYELDGQHLECSLARPWAEQKQGCRMSSQKGLHHSHHDIPQPLIYGNVMSRDLAMTPMLLPDGQIGYILQPRHLSSPVDAIYRNGRRGSIRSDGPSSSRHSYDEHHRHRHSSVDTRHRNGSRDSVRNDGTSSSGSRHDHSRFRYTPY